MKTKNKSRRNFYTMMAESKARREKLQKGVTKRKIDRDTVRKKIAKGLGVNPRRVILTSRLKSGQVPTYTVKGGV